MPHVLKSMQAYLKMSGIIAVAIGLVALISLSVSPKKFAHERPAGPQAEKVRFHDDVRF